MEQEQHCDRTVLIVQRSIDDAVSLQDRLVRAGGRVLTGYSLGRALLLAKKSALDDAIIDFDFEGVEEIVFILKSRKVPFIFSSGSEPLKSQEVARMQCQAQR